MQKRQVCSWRLWSENSEETRSNRSLSSDLLGRHLEYRFIYNVIPFSLFSVTVLIHSLMLILSLNSVIRVPFSFSFQTDPVEQKIWLLAVVTMPYRPLRCSRRLVIRKYWFVAKYFITDNCVYYFTCGLLRTNLELRIKYTQIDFSNTGWDGLRLNCSRM